MYDYQLMAKWLTDKKVLEFSEGRDNPFPLKRIIKTYKFIIRGDEPIVPCLFYYRNALMDYLQYYALNDLPETDRQLYYFR